MNAHKPGSPPEPSSRRAFQSLVLDASDEELDAALNESGADVSALASETRGVVEAAIAEVAVSGPREDEAEVLHLGLGTLVRMLRRKKKLDPLELAEAAGVDVEEVNGIESNPHFEASPMTLVRLERFFQLEGRSLAFLAGAIHRPTEALKDEVVRFAAYSSGTAKLTREQKKALNAFVRFLGKFAREGPK